MNFVFAWKDREHFVAESNANSWLAVKIIGYSLL